MASEHENTRDTLAGAPEGDSVAVEPAESSAQVEQGETAAQAPPVKRTRKVAAKKVAAPRKRAVKKAAVATAPDSGTTADPADVAATGQAPTGQAPTVQAPTGQVPTDQATGDQAPANGPLSQPAAADESAGTAADVPTGTDDPSAPVAAKKAARPARKRASRKVAAPQEAPALLDAAPADSAVEPAPVPDAAPAVDVPVDPAHDTTVDTTVDVPSEPTSVESARPEPQTSDDPAPSPFGIVFQPPAPPTRRRRRASAPVGQPTLDAPLDQVAESGPVEAEAPAPESTPTEPTPEPTLDTAADLGAPETTQAVTDDDTADTADTDDTDDTDDDETTDESSGDALTDDETSDQPRRRRRRGGKGRRGRGGASTDEQGADTPPSGRSSSRAVQPATGTDAGSEAAPDDEQDDTDAGAGDGGGSSRRRTRRRRRSGAGSGESDDAPNVVTRVREPRRQSDEVTGVKGSTRLEAKKQRRREGREAGRRRTVITEAEFLARRESVERVMVVRHKDDRTQIGVLEDDVLVEHYISRETNVSMAGNIYLGRVQNVLPSMEAAFVDIGKGRNAVLYAGEVNWDAAGLEHGQGKRIENALGSGQSVLVQVTKDPIGHKGARLTSQISLPGRYLVYVPDSSMTGISRKLPDTERARLKKILKEIVPESAGVIVRTAAEGASEEELRADVARLTRTWEDIQAKVEGAGGATTKGKGKAKGGSAPVLLHGEPDLTVRVIRDVFNEDFGSLVVAGEQAWNEVSDYVDSVAPDLAARVTRWTSEEDLFTHYRIDEQLAKAMDRKVWLPSGGSLVIDRTEAMTVIDVNTGKFVGSGGNLEETVTKNNIEAAEEIVRQLRVRDIGGIIVVDFIDMVLEANRDLVVRRLLECLGRDRTKHQVAEVTSLGLVQMTRKRVGSGLIEVFSENCEHCAGRGIIVHTDPVDRSSGSGSLPVYGSGSSGEQSGSGQSSRSRRGRAEAEPAPVVRTGGPTPAQIAAAAHAAAIKAAEVRADADGSSYDAPEAAAEAADPSTGVDPALAAAVAEAMTEALAVDLPTEPTADLPAEPTADVPQEPTADVPQEPELEVELPGRQGRQGRGRQPRRSRSAAGARGTTLESAPMPDSPGPVAAEPVAPELAASEPVASEPVAPQPVAPQPMTAEPAMPETVKPDHSDAEAAAPARGRRRRGRVVAPAGPPRAGSEQGSPAAETPGSPA